MKLFHLMCTVIQFLRSLTCHAVQRSLQSLMLSMSVAQLPSVESPSQALAHLREHFNADSVSSLSAPYHVADLSLDNSSSHLVIVQLPETGAAGTGYGQTLSAIGKFCRSAIMVLCVSNYNSTHTCTQTDMMTFNVNFVIWLPSSAAKCDLCTFSA